jgi:hypothetical protein
VLDSSIDTQVLAIAQDNRKSSYASFIIYPKVTGDVEVATTKYLHSSWRRRGK